MLLTQVSVCYILKHSEDRKALSVYIYCTCGDIILIFKLHRKSRLMPRSSIHSLTIQKTSHPCNNIKIMPCVEGDRSDCQPEASSVAQSRRLRAVVVVEG